MRAFITGITGFVGSHLAEYLLTLPDMEVYGLARWRSPLDNLKNVIGKVKLLQGDLTDESSLRYCLNECKPDYVFHLAAQSYVQYSFRAPSATLQANCIGTVNLLQSLRWLTDECGAPPVIHCCSSSEVYGQPNDDELPIRETNPLRPASPYAVSKVCEDMLAYQYWLSWGLPIIRTRMFTHTGNRRGDVFVESNFAKQIAEIEAGIRPPVVYVGNLDSVRTFADVRDTVRAYWLLVNKCRHGEVYNIGGNRTMTVGKMLEYLISISKTKVDIAVDPARLRPSDVTMQIPCIDKFVSETGWKPEIPFEQTMADLLDYWRGRVQPASV